MVAWKLITVQQTLIDEAMTSPEQWKLLRRLLRNFDGEGQPYLPGAKLAANNVRRW